MGQLISSIQSKFRGQEWKHRQLKKISDKVFYHFKEDSSEDLLSFEDLYIAVLFVYNDINKHFPGPHIDPPSKARVRAVMESYDVNLDGQLNLEEFEGFMEELTKDALVIISRNAILTLIVAPAVALMTKRATEGVPGVGKVVQRIPNSIYASIITLAVMMLQNSGTEFE